MIKYYKISDSRLVECTKEENILSLYVAPGIDEIKSLSTEHGIDEHDISSSLDSDELGRLEFNSDYTTIIFKRPKNYSSMDNLMFLVNSLGIFLFKDKMVLIISEDIQLFEAKLFTKISTVYDILIKLIYGTIFHFIGHLKVINMVSDSLEHKLSSSMENKFLLNMFTLEKSLVYYLNAINTNSGVIEKLKINAKKIPFSQDNLELIDDIIIENQQCLKQAEIYSNILTGLMDARGSMVNNNLSILMKRLTVINIVFMPLNLLAGIGGMSEFSMMTAGIKWQISYPLFLFAMVIIGFLTYAIIENLGKNRRFTLVKSKKRKNGKR